MKKTHIIAIVIIAVAIGAIISTLSDSSTYADFAEAFNNPGEEFHVVGKLDKSAAIDYNPNNDPNLTVFTMIDNQGRSSKVYLSKSKPQDFERSESVVLIGKVEGDAFYANNILMKCPSKYSEQNQMKAGNG
ncbi:MAG TPA: cytochrome c maturation protein CcmE [Luteibaculaceae bacterium]|nr:cytochrome c maturation protein CcmE [Luteibaculaceae bacterium]